MADHFVPAYEKVHLRDRCAAETWAIASTIEET
jgi:hypothetical protein